MIDYIAKFIMDTPTILLVYNGCSYYFSYLKNDL